MPALRRKRSFQAPRRRALQLASALALLAHAGCVEIVGDFRTAGAAGSGGSGGSGSTSSSGASSGAAGSDGECGCDGGVICTDPDCTKTAAWIKPFGDKEDQFITGVAVNAEDEIVVTGGVAGTIDFGGGALESGGDYDAYVAKLDPSGNQLFGKRFGNAGTDRGMGVAVDRDGNILVTGVFQGTVDFGEKARTSAGGFDIFVAKLDPEGKFLWAKAFGDGFEQLGVSVTTDQQGDVIITGCSQGAVDFGGGARPSNGYYDVFVAKLNGDGEHLWSHIAGGAGYECGSRAIADAQDNVYVTGTFTSTFTNGPDTLTHMGQADVFLMKLSADGQPVWSRSIGSPWNEYASGVTLDPAGNPIVAGSFEQTVTLGGAPVTSTSAHDPYIAAWSPDGAPLWGRPIAEPNDQYIFGAAVDKAGSVFICGYTTTNVADNALADVYVARVSPEGKVLWSEAPGAPLEQSAVLVAFDGAGAPILVGNFAGMLSLSGATLTSNGGRDIFVDKLNSLQ